MFHIDSCYVAPLTFMQSDLSTAAEKGAIYDRHFQRQVPHHQFVPGQEGNVHRVIPLLFPEQFRQRLFLPPFIHFRDLVFQPGPHVTLQSVQRLHAAHWYSATEDRAKSSS